MNIPPLSQHTPANSATRVVKMITSVDDPTAPFTIHSRDGVPMRFQSIEDAALQLFGVECGKTIPEVADEAK